MAKRKAAAAAVIGRDPRIDAYIENAADFARPILTYLREVVHEGCPDVTETLKWSMPSFEYKGILCGMAAFKRHCAFGFWKHELVVGADAPPGQRNAAMGEFGRISEIGQLPSRRRLLAYVRKAVKLNEEGVPARPRAARAARPAPRTPADLAAALKANPAAAKVFAGFSPSHKREYIEWITEAKAAETRARRLATALEWIAEGKARNWRYERRK